ncbi:macro domain-containing protein [Paenibacillus hamazuiensis]|uniref:macro domain-containing protein n=1 Tax=Paenibacillus hamazuiensis TaxID=2936508 RepID=UPI00200F604E|nr:macro domain-containing protein [Paenibacillus hamazuiensis]
MPKRFLTYWLSAFSIIWTFIEFSGYFFTMNGQPWKPPVWAVLIMGVAAAVWLCRPRLTKSAPLNGKEIQIEVTVNDMFQLKNGSFIIPVNCFFRHDHLESGTILAQFRDKYFSGPAHFDSALEEALRQEAYEPVTVGGRQWKKYPIGTVARLRFSTGGFRTAYLLATADLNEYGKAVSDPAHLNEALSALWQYIGNRGETEPLIIPVMGSGRHRLTQPRFSLISEILQSFIQSVSRRKFTEKLTVVIYPRAYMEHKYNLEEMDQYLQYLTKFSSG